MTTLTVEIDRETDLSALQEVLSKMGLKYHLEEEDDWGDLPEEAIEGIKAGLADIEAGRTHTHEYVMADEQTN
jgi:predicted transcriptional regulator